MKTKFLPCGLLAALLAARLCATPLMETTAIHAMPDASTAAISYLKAGTEPVVAVGVPAPDGWLAIELPGPHEVFVSNHDLGKSLDVAPGASLRFAPQASAPIVGTMKAGEKAEVTGLRGNWTQVRLHQSLIGYIRGGVALPPPPPPVAANLPPPLSAAPVVSSSAPMAVVPSTSTAAPAAPVSIAPVIDIDRDTSSMPRTFQGRLVSTKRFFRIGPKPYFDYQLNDSANRRTAFLDFSKLLLTDKLEYYVDHPVVISGIVRKMIDGEDLVIVVEHLQLR